VKKTEIVTLRVNKNHKGWIIAENEQFFHILLSSRKDKFYITLHFFLDF
jgi:hypothetical protein